MTRLDHDIARIRRITETPIRCTCGRGCGDFLTGPEAMVMQAQFLNEVATSGKYLETSALLVDIADSIGAMALEDQDPRSVLAAFGLYQLAIVSYDAGKLAQ